MLFVVASVTDKVADWAIRVVGDLGLPGIFLLMTPESACIPIPSEPTMLFAGFSVHNGKYSVVAAVLVATLANLVGSWIAYAVGYYGRVEAFERHRWFHVTPARLAQAERWFERNGSAAVFFSRMLPIVRTFISLPAGVAPMPLPPFSVLPFPGALPWDPRPVVIRRSP